MKLHNFALVVGLKLHSRNKLDFMFYLEVRSCGGIDPYTLTARLGPGGLAHYETSLRFDPTAWSLAQGSKMWRSNRILVG